MKNTILFFTFLLSALFSRAQFDDYVIDTFTNDTLVTLDNTYQEMVFPNFNEFEAIDVLQFKFQDTLLEKYRTENLMPYFINSWKQDAFKNKITEEGTKIFSWLVEQEGSEKYRNNPASSYQLKEIELNVISYLGDVVTLEQKVFCEIAKADEEFELVDYFYLNLKTKKLLTQQEFNKSVNETVLKKTLLTKWEGIASVINPEKLCYNIQGLVHPLLEEEKTGASCIPLNTTIKNAINQLSLDKIRLFWNGSALMVQLEKPFKHHPTLGVRNLQLALDVRELEGLLSKTSSYAPLSKHTKISSTISNVDFPNVNWQIMRLRKHHFDFLEIPDKNIAYIDYSFQQFVKSDTQFIHRIYYNNEGKAYKVDNLNKVKGRNKKQIVDYITWENGIPIQRLSRVIEGTGKFRKSSSSYNQMQKTIYMNYDAANNINQKILLTSGISVEQFSFFSNGFSSFDYAIFSDYTNRNRLPKRYTVNNEGWCTVKNLCLKVKEGRLLQYYNDKYIYNEEGQLIQTIGSQYSYKLFNYDKQGRLTTVEESNHSTFIKYRYSYHKNDKTPYLTETKSKDDREWRKYHSVIHYK